MNNEELKSLVALLDDDDDEVVAHVEKKLKTLGNGVLPFFGRGKFSIMSWEW